MYICRNYNFMDMFTIEFEKPIKVAIEQDSFMQWITSPNTILALLAILISIITLIISIKYTSKTIKIAERHNKLSVEPLLNFNINSSEKNSMSIILGNYGLGSAKIKSMLIICNGSYFKNLESFYDGILKNMNIKVEKIMLIGELEVISSNVNMELFNFKYDSFYREKIISILKNTNIKISYLTMYDETREINCRIWV